MKEIKYARSEKVLTGCSLALTKFVIHSEVGWWWQCHRKEEDVVSLLSAGGLVRIRTWKKENRSMMRVNTRTEEQHKGVIKVCDSPSVCSIY